MKRSTKTYFRTLYLSLVIMSCLCFGWIGISEAYENTVKIAFGEERKALEYKDGNLYILDFIINIKKHPHE